MIFHFSLYGFLKNQRYFEPFLLLAFLQKGLTYFQIGLLIGFKGLVVNLLEVPTGVVADAYGKRASMMASFVAYCFSFVLLGACRDFLLLGLGMFLFGIGEAFRTGTHKAIIFDWLQAQGRIADRDKVYGFTRSWSKFGSALSALIAAGLVFMSGNYSRVFFFSVFPYLLGLGNFLFYPADRPATRKNRSFFRLFREAVVRTFRRPHLRDLLSEAALFEGPYKVAKDYIQPILRSTALALPILAGLDDVQRSALLIGFVFTVLYLLEGLASRNSALFVSRWCGGEQKAVRLFWGLNTGGYIVLALVLYGRVHLVAIACFLLLAALQNLWRPNMIGRLAEVSTSENRATVLSINSQMDSVLAMVLAPAVGWCVDYSGGNLWAAGVLPAILAVLGLAMAARNLRRSHS